jgi:hypothetical protein
MIRLKEEVQVITIDQIISTRFIKITESMEFYLNNYMLSVKNKEKEYRTPSVMFDYLRHLFKII